MINKTKLIFFVGLISYSTIFANEVNTTKELNATTPIKKDMVKVTEANSTTPIKKDIAKVEDTNTSTKVMNSTLLMSEIADKFIKLEQDKNKNEVSVDGKILTKVEKATLKATEATDLDKAHVNQMISKFKIQKSFPIALGYYKINNVVYATVQYHGKKYNLKKNNTLGGFRLINIYDNRLKFVTPSGQIISSHYETLTSRGKRK